MTGLFFARLRLHLAAAWSPVGYWLRGRRWELKNRWARWFPPSCAELVRGAKRAAATQRAILALSTALTAGTAGWAGQRLVIESLEPVMRSVVFCWCQINSTGPCRCPPRAVPEAAWPQRTKDRLRRWWRQHDADMSYPAKELVYEQADREAGLDSTDEEG